ncbi:hypothetical protein [Candidatus Darwinibacter acetoxidans]|jgi:hypothetical protein
MIRKAILVTVFAFALLSVSVFGSAQDLWRLNEFTAAYERLLYELVSYDEMWDEDLEKFVTKENVYYEQWELVAGEGRLEVTMGHRYWLPREHVKQDMSFMGAPEGTIVLERRSSDGRLHVDRPRRRGS